MNEDMILAVKRGAHFMDEHYPNWATAIQLDRLEMNDCAVCVVGQAIGDYSNSIAEMSGTRSYSREANDWAEENGFDVPNALSGDYAIQNYYRKLETLWTEQVRERLGDGL